MKVAYFDCFSGAGGDMIVASLIDAGADASALRERLASLSVEGYSLTIESVNKQGFAATRFSVPLDQEARQPHRHLSDIISILDKSSLPATARNKAARIFERLANAEAKVHGVPVEKVHFHEAGAVDAIIDVVGAVLALELLGIERVICSPIPTGSGTITCDHGVMPVPAPATVELLKGVPLARCAREGELITPTAAAVLTTLAAEFGPIPSMTVDSVGYGAGTRDGGELPNLLRVLVGRLTGEGEGDEIAVLETNLDDASPELVGHCLERLLDAGALDVYTVPIQMKKSRSGVVLTVLCRYQQVPVMERILFAETTTFGVRRHNVHRACLTHRHETVATAYGELRIKIGERDGIVTASPEYEDCKAAAHEHDVPLREVMAAVSKAWAVQRNS